MIYQHVSDKKGHMKKQIFSTGIMILPWNAKGLQQLTIKLKTSKLYKKYIFNAHVFLQV